MGSSILHAEDNFTGFAAGFCVGMSDGAIELYKEPPFSQACPIDMGNTGLNVVGLKQSDHWIFGAEAFFAFKGGDHGHIDRIEGVLWQFSGHEKFALLGIVGYAFDQCAPYIEIGSTWVSAQADPKTDDEHFKKTKWSGNGLRASIGLMANLSSRIRFTVEAFMYRAKLTQDNLASYNKKDKTEVDASGGRFSLAYRF